MADLAQGNIYFDTYILNNTEWAGADDPTKTRALNQASKMLYRAYGYKYDEATNPMNDEAIFEQALWLLRVDDTIRRAEQGITSVMVDGIQIALSKTNRTFAPQVIQLLGRKIGRSISGREGVISK